MKSKHGESLWFTTVPNIANGTNLTDWLATNLNASEWFVAEARGFEPLRPVRVCRVSNAVLSTTQPRLHYLYC